MHILNLSFYMRCEFASEAAAAAPSEFIGDNAVDQVQSILWYIWLKLGHLGE